MSWERNLLKGKQGEEIIHNMLDESGYAAISYGYEKSLSGLANRLREKKTEYCGDVERQIRSTPDFIVYDPAKPVGGGYFQVADLMLLEVKTRKLLNRYNSNFMLYEESKKDRIEDYLKFWGNSLLVVVIPKYDFFYVREMKTLLPDRLVYNAKNDFQKFQKIFSRVTDETIRKYQFLRNKLFHGCHWFYRYHDFVT